ncbi:uncharacterized protein ACA1_329650 [Acanthamoeba castellanii str. Neff]|uniref:Thioesterase domain-containing protein n=1 Tax=Acanthamoeba castellanii (strain ATCC 30010 / Neff) TaxID=1257118 RepID=L8GI86_ACACF|nr:uncharacterized protein ACA1_329650 [Acanthamoeba castellanii str. Neff]ELR12559.1 hypothetical protein ACA1_329650 [Acanthamoeba castellanii str. Neff]
MDQLPTVEEAEEYSSAVVEHPYESFEDLLFNNMRMEALDEMERSIRYVLDVNDDLSVLSGGFFRHGMFGALADMTGSSLISHIYEYDLTTPQGILSERSMLDMKLSVQSALQAPSTVRIESRMRRHGDTLAFVQTQFYTNDRPLARAKTTHYIATASARRPPTHTSSSSSTL